MKRPALVLILALLFASVSPIHAAEWEFDKAHTQVRFRVKHLMVTDVWGEFHTFQGTVIYDPAHPEKASVNVSIDASSVDTGNEFRDKDLRSERFFYYEKYPQATFISKKVEKTEKGLTVTGDLSIRGVTKEITLSVTGPTAPFPAFGGTKISASATARINRYDYGLTWNKTIEGGGLVVDPMVDIVIDAELNKKE